MLFENNETNGMIMHMFASASIYLMFKLNKKRKGMDLSMNIIISLITIPLFKSNIGKLFEK